MTLSGLCDRRRLAGS